MRKLLAGAAVVVAAVLAVSGPAGAVADSGIEIVSADASGYPTVSAVVATPGALAGEAFAADAFEVLEAGIPVPAAVERIPTDDLEVMLVLDTSGSMAGAPIESEKAAAGEFVSLLPAEVSVGVVAYGSTPVLIAAPSTDRQAVTASIAPLQAGTDTALYDAVIFAAGQFTPAAERRSIVLLTDGEDNVSVASVDAALAAAAGVPINVIELVTERTDRPTLEQLAAAAGGLVSSATDPAALTDLYRQAAGTVANQYRVTYTSSANGPVELTVRAAAADRVVSASTTVELPGQVVVASTTPPTTTPPTTTPPTTAPASIAPPTPPTQVPVRAAAATPDQPNGSRLGLLLGGAAVYAALLVITAVILSGDRRRRDVRTGLGLESARAAGTSVTKLKDRTAAGVDRFLERRDRSRSVASSLEAAGISLRPGEFIVLVLAATAAGGLLTLTLFGLIGLLATLVIAPLIARTVLTRRAAHRRARFAEQLADNLQLLTSSLKSGYGLFAALDSVAQEAEEPSRDEFRRVLLEIRVGRDASEALDAMAARMASKDFEWVVGAIDINREVGGDLALTLDNVAETIRERQNLARHVSALTAEGRLSTYILIALPVFVALAMSAINPGYLEPLFSGIGPVLLGVGAGMLLAGWLWMKRLIRVEF